MSAFTKYLKIIQEKGNFVDLRSSKYKVVVSIDSEKKGFQFEIDPEDNIAQLSQALRQKSKDLNLNKEITVAIPAGFNNQTKLSKIFDEENDKISEIDETF